MIDLLVECEKVAKMIKLALNDVYIANQKAAMGWTQEDVRSLIAESMPNWALREAPEILFIAHVRELLLRRLGGETRDANVGTAAETYAALLVADRKMTLIPFADTLLGAVMIHLLHRLVEFIPNNIDAVPPNVTRAELEELWRQVENRADKESRLAVVTALFAAATKDRQYFDVLKMSEYASILAPEKSENKWYDRITQTCKN